MKISKLIFAFVLLIITGLHLEGQSIRGKVVDAANGSELPFANVVISGTTTGAQTDLDGVFSIEGIEAGTYILEVSYLAYETKKIEGINVENGEVVALGEISLNEASAALKEVVVTEKALRNTEGAVMTLQRKGIGTLDAISSQAFNMSGAGDAASAMKNVTGVSVEGGKYVYVRGLGDRYSKTFLNGSEIPGLDPDKNTVQMDLFPTNLIDNIVVYKTFTPNLPGSFTGGLVDITTKDFPDQFTMKASIGVSCNTQTTFNDNFLTYEGSSTDWLGFDNGMRDVPDGIDPYDISQRYAGDGTELQAQTQAFNDVVEPSTKTAPLNKSVSFSLGNQKKLFGKSFGYIASLYYKNSHSMYENGTSGRWKLTGSYESDEVLNKERLLNDNRSTEDVMLGGMWSASMKFNDKNKVGLNVVLNQSASNTTRFQEGENPSDDPNRFLQERIMAFQERSFAAFQLKGKHSVNPKLVVDWISSYSLANMNQPDLRYMSNVYTLNQGNNGEVVDTNYAILASIGKVPTRYWRSLSENATDSKINATYHFKSWNGLKSNLKFGMAYSQKWRQFREEVYEFGQDGNSFGGDFVEYLSDENAWSLDNTGGIFLSSDSRLSNQYDASLRIGAFYAMTELAITQRFKSIVGFRGEWAQLPFTSLDPNLELDNTLLLNDLDILPSISLIYELVQNKMNLRASYNKTLARPSFKEIAPIAFFDYYLDIIFIGNENLESSRIDNVDFRWEYFFRPGEMASISAFYKNFDGQIEITNNPEQPNGEWTFRNSESGKVYGLEFELRKKLDFIPQLSNFSWGANVTLVKSSVKMDSLEYVVKQARNPNVSDTRVLFGQSPYMINTYFSYKNTIGTNARLGFNMQGERLTVISQGSTPDIYEQPFPLLNFKITQSLNNGIGLSFGVNNLLGSVNKQTQNFKGNEYLFQYRDMGRTISFGLSYDFARGKK